MTTLEGGTALRLQVRLRAIAERSARSYGGRSALRERPGLMGPLRILVVAHGGSPAVCAAAEAIVHARRMTETGDVIREPARTEAGSDYGVLKKFSTPLIVPQLCV